MEKINVESVTDGNESESEQNSIEEKNENSLTDIATLDITSRLSLKTTEIYGESHRNGISRVNGICNSPERITSMTNLTQPETTQLNQHGTLSGTLESRVNHILFTHIDISFIIGQNYVFWRCLVTSVLVPLSASWTSIEKS